MFEKPITWYVECNVIDGILIPHSLHKHENNQRTLFTPDRFVIYLADNHKKGGRPMLSNLVDKRDHSESRDPVPLERLLF